MAEILTYDPSNDPTAIAAAEERDAESLAVGEELEAQHESLLAGKYKNAEELEKAYLELQGKLGGRDEEEGVADDDELIFDDEDVDEAEFEANEAVELFEVLNEEYDENGSLSEESLETLKELSSEELVNAYFQMQDKLSSEPSGIELSDADVQSIQQSVGGADNYQALTEWAADNFEADEIAAFDGVVESGNVGAINLALQALYYRYVDANGSDGELLQGKAAAPSNGFRSQAEVVAAMQDSRYDRDPAYRADVMRRLENSDINF